MNEGAHANLNLKLQKSQRRWQKDENNNIKCADCDYSQEVSLAMQNPLIQTYLRQLVRSPNTWNRIWVMASPTIHSKSYYMPLSTWKKEDKIGALSSLGCIATNVSSLSGVEFMREIFGGTLVKLEPQHVCASWYIGSPLFYFAFEYMLRMW